MIHELKQIIDQAIINQRKGLKNVLASVVHLEGSSYRKPGVRMLISEDFKTVGAVSGGCVEKEIIQRSKSVFEKNIAKIITYDGRYRLGCEGTLYILIEPFFVTESFVDAFNQSLEKREHLFLESSFNLADENEGNFYTKVLFKNGSEFSFSDNLKKETDAKIFKQNLAPRFRLLLIGGEHDAVQLCKIASNLGWQVDVLTSAKDSQNIADFPGANTVTGKTPETFEKKDNFENTAVVIMNHSYVQDLKYLIKLAEHQPKYVGVLGSTKKRDRLLNELFDFAPETSEDFLDSIYSPAGLNIGAKTPEEIAVSIIAEISTIFRNKQPFSLREVSGKIHS